MTYILPQLDRDIDNLKSSIFARIEAAKTSTYRIDSVKDILDIEYMDLKYLLHYNIDFFNHTMKVADKVVAQIIRTHKEMCADSDYEEDWNDYELLKDVETLNDLLYSCDYLGDNYESRRKSFVDLFADATEQLEEYFV